MPGIEDELTEKVGGIPVWGIGVGVSAIAIGVIWWRGRHAANAAGAGSTATATPQTTVIREGGSGGGESLSALEEILADNTGRAFYGPGNFPPGVPAPTTNEQWAHLMIDHFVGAGEDPALVTDAFYRYLRRQRLTNAEAGIIDLALEISIPPQGYLPVLRGGKPDKDRKKKPDKDNVRVPSVVGEDAANAESRIKAAGLEVDFDPRPDGRVSWQNPSPGTRVDKGSVVTLYMSGRDSGS